MRLSACILTRNEERNLARLLPSLSFCNEVVAVDDYSTDATLKVLQKHMCRVYRRNLNGDFSAQRNYGLSKVKGDWVLFVDADEYVTKKLRKEILSSLKSGADGYQFRRFDYLWGRLIKHGEISDFNSIRLARKTSGKWKRRVHEYWDVKGKIVQINEPLLHYPHQDLSIFVSDIKKYAVLHAEANLSEGKVSSVLDIIFRPLGKFVVGYFLKGGFKDGLPGFIIALVMSYHSFLAWKKLWLMQDSSPTN